MNTHPHTTEPDWLARSHRKTDATDIYHEAGLGYESDDVMAHFERVEGQFYANGACQYGDDFRLLGFAIKGDDGVHYWPRDLVEKVLGHSAICLLETHEMEAGI